ncbi:MAG: epimerase [Renibacterium sp.]|nr:epimerase [Renibacterium sp.]
MRLLILGGTVFLSRNIARAAVARGHQVTALARGSRPVPAGAMLHVADRDQGVTAFAGLTGEWDAVIDVARDPVQVGAARQALSGRVAHWTFVSTLSVYADQAVAGQDESAELLPGLAEGADAAAEYGAAKVACEQLFRSATEPFAIVRPGLICGPGDPSDRYGYWPARFARDNGPALLPDLGAMATQVIDARDLALWLVELAESGTGGVFDACGPTVPWRTLIGAAMEVAGYSGRLRLADPAWLSAHGVSPWAGPESLPLWLPEDAFGLMARSGAAARAAGLRLRPFDQTLESVLADEKSRGLGRERRAGLSQAREAELLALLAG